MPEATKPVASRVLGWILVGLYLYAQAAMSLPTWKMVTGDQNVIMHASRSDTARTAPVSETQVLALNPDLKSPATAQDKDKTPEGYRCSFCCCAVSDTSLQPEIHADGDRNGYPASLPAVSLYFLQFRPPKLL